MSCPSIVMRAALQVVKAQQQVDDGRFARAGAADQPDPLARLELEAPGRR